MGRFDLPYRLQTFVLEVVLKGREREVAGLLIVLRLWRIVKLVGGVAVGAGELAEAQSKEFGEVKAELDRTREQLAALQRDNTDLRRRTAGDGLE